MARIVVIISLLMFSGVFVHNCEARTYETMQKKNCGAREKCNWVTLSEKRLLSMGAHNANRNKAVLSLNLLDGKKIELVDVHVKEESSQTYDKMVEYGLFEELESPPYYMVWMSRYESSGTLLINKKTGVRTLIDDVPTVSPNKSWFVTVDFREAHSNNRLQIWKIDPKGLRMEFEYTPEEYWSDVDVTWINNSIIRITLTGDEGSTVKRHIEYAHERNQWKIISEQ